MKRTGVLMKIGGINENCITQVRSRRPNGKYSTLKDGGCKMRKLCFVLVTLFAVPFYLTADTLPAMPPSGFQQNKSGIAHGQVSASHRVTIP